MKSVAHQQRVTLICQRCQFEMAILGAKHQFMDKHWARDHLLVATNET
jgi:hypothetical protein